MKTLAFFTERVKLYAYGFFTALLALSFFLSHTDHSVADFFDVSQTLTRTNSSQVILEFESKPINGDDKKPKLAEQATCNVFDGDWVYDPQAGPLYNAEQCPFLSDQVSCRRNGRPDSEYQNWRWQPKACNISRNNIGIEMLERLRGKRMVIVGDSLNRNQWESLTCILHSASPNRSGLLTNTGGYKIFHAQDYNCSVEFYWSPFLVQLDLNETDGTKILKLDTIAGSAVKWKGADIMVFNTGHWWGNFGKSPSETIFLYEGKQTETMDAESALRLAMETWQRWVRANVDPAKARVFFRSISPEHKLKQWCYNETSIITDDSSLGGYPVLLSQQIESKIREIGGAVTYLNITRLSQYRKDAHPSIYHTKDGKRLVAEKKLQPARFADCSHWCLPGLPDTWNSLMFASMALESSRDILTS